mmetsp:Transcript_18794/g.47650  ORF Transcript_18794/g.47650 Transcript_18794/m.47650 type:complete len:222 (+) Transcript_18794:3569-4234(+)
MPSFFSPSSTVLHLLQHILGQEMVDSKHYLCVHCRDMRQSSCEGGCRHTREGACPNSSFSLVHAFSSLFALRSNHNSLLPPLLFLLSTLPLFAGRLRHSRTALSAYFHLYLFFVFVIFSFSFVFLFAALAGHLLTHRKTHFSTLLYPFCTSLYHADVHVFRHLCEGCHIDGFAFLSYLTHSRQHCLSSSSSSFPSLPSLPLLIPSRISFLVLPFVTSIANR